MRNVKLKGSVFVESSTGDGPWLFPHVSGSALAAAIEVARFMPSYGTPTAKASVSRREREGYRPWMKAKIAKALRLSARRRRMVKNGFDFHTKVAVMSPAKAAGYLAAWD